MEMKCFPLGPLWTNGYLVWDGEGRSFFVDPGGDPSEVIRFLESRSLRLETILLTHGHADHLFGLEALREKASCGVALHEDDASALPDPSINLSRWMGADCLCRPAEKMLRDGESFTVGTLEIEVRHTPGHSLGSVCYLVRDGVERLLLSGDTLFAGSIGRSDLPGGDSRQLLHSLKRLIDLPDDLPVYPGHGPSTTIGVERRENPYWPREAV
jgi:hydroxyacylglutathione hydrolase